MSGVVIELGSSDEERPEPKPKKSKPPPNAMVHIPGKFPEVTITPAVACNSKNTNPKKVVFNSKLVSIPKKGQPRVIKINPSHPDIIKPIQIQCVQSNKLTNKPKPVILKNLLANTAKKMLQNPVKLQKTITNLPSSITIKRTKGQVVKRPVKRKHTDLQSNVVETFDLDDDEPATDPLPVGPQWYVRPEDQTDIIISKKKNNEEPKTPNFIEITIEDSPVKPSSKKTVPEVSDLAVTIEDSPVKSVGCRTPSKKRDASTPKKKKSQKVLQYPKELVEIEIEPATAQLASTENENNIANDPIFEVMESPLKVPDEVTQSPKKPRQTNTKPPSPTNKDNNDIISIDDEAESEFHPVYQSLIDLCFKLENSDDMKKIVEKKIKAYYRQVPKSYTESEEFIDMVSTKILLITAGPDKMYLHIKDIVDELNLQRKMARNTVKDADDDKKNEAQTFLYGEESQFDAKRQRQIRKLEKTIKKLHRAIQKLEEQEVDFDDEDDSVYLLTERYKERMIKVHAKFCQLTNTKMPSEPRIHIDTAPGKPTGAAKRIEKWINRKVPIGAPLPFPDFHDVLRCVREANAEDNLGWNEVDIMEEARSLFVRCGRKLQRRRQENEWRLAASRITVDVDPAEKDDNLKKQLDENRKTATNKETEVFNKFADRQNQLKLEAEEIEDKEAEESPVDSEEEDVEDNVSLDNKEKRKYIIKRLLQEKTTNNKENNAVLVHADVEMKDLQGNEKEGEKTEIEKHTEEDDSKSSKTNNPSNSMDIDSDIDELHLLQKLHPKEEGNTSYSELSDSATTISISDSLSDTDNKNYKSDDVISIENSSFSETDANDNLDKHDIICSSYEETEKGAADIFRPSQLTNVSESKDADESSMMVPEESDNRCKLVIEGISLASSEDENSQSSAVIQNSVNLNDDVISIGETTLSVLDKEAAFDENESENILLQGTSNDSQLNEDMLLATEDKVSEEDQPIIDSSAHVDELIVQGDAIVEAKESEVNSETNLKNGLSNDADINEEPKENTNSFMSEGILLASSEDDDSHDVTNVETPNCVTVNDSAIITTVTNENDGSQSGSTKTNEEKHSSDLQKPETEVIPSNDDPKNATVDCTSIKTIVSDDLKNSTGCETIADESMDTDIGNKPCNGDTVTANESQEIDLDIDMTETSNNKISNTVAIDTESNSKLHSMESQQIDDNLKDT